MRRSANPEDPNVMSIINYNSGKDRYRQGSYSNLNVLWPFVHGAVHPRFQELVRNLESQIDEILRRYGISDGTINASCIAYKDNPQWRNVLFCDTRNEPSYDPMSKWTGWWPCANEIQTLVSRNSAELNLNISVEIRNPEKMFRDISYPLERWSKEHYAWMQMEDSIIHELDRQCYGKWNVLAFVLRGPDNSSQRVPTVVVLVNEEVMHPWQMLEKQIEQVIKTKCNSNIKIAIQILPGVITGLGQNNLTKRSDDLKRGPKTYEDLPVVPRSGDSIGPLGQDNSGTLGMYVMYTPKNKPHLATKCFLTCYHVIRTFMDKPGDDEQEILDYVDEYGFALLPEEENYGQTINVTYPSGEDAAATMQLLKQRANLRGDPNGILKAKYMRLKNIIETGGIGRVIKASGLMFQEVTGGKNGAFDRKVDWAIVECTDREAKREGKTYLPLYHADLIPNDFKAYYDVIPNEQCNGIADLVRSEILPHEEINPLPKMASQWVGKEGRSSGITTGYVSGAEITCNWAIEGDDSVESPKKKKTVYVKTKEWAVMNGDPGTMWYRDGDYGAATFNMDKKWVGMVVGKNQASLGIGVVTPVKDLMASIEEKTGGTIRMAT